MTDCLHDDGFAAYETAEPLPGVFMSVPVPAESGGGEECAALRKLREMRRIKSDETPFSRLYGGRDAAQFVRQARFLADFEDSMPGAGKISCRMARPTYSDLSTEQLRAYFTWRTGYRRGDVRSAPAAFALLHAFELIHGVGAASSEDRADKLAALWRWARGEHPQLDGKFHAWFRDIYLCGDFGCTFRDLVLRCGVKEWYGEVFCEEGDSGFLRLMLRLADYRGDRSRFFLENPRLTPGLEHCFLVVLRNLKPLLLLRGLTLDDLMLVQPDRWSFYEPFREAVHYAAAPWPDKRVTLSNMESYRCRGGSWSRARAFDLNYGSSPVLGYIVRRLEAEFRNQADYPQKSNPRAAQVYERWVGTPSFSRLLWDVVRDPRFDEIVDGVARAWWAAGGALPADCLLPQVRDLAGLLAEEPYPTLFRVREIGQNGTRAGQRRQFAQQAALLAPLEDGTPFSENPELPEELQGGIPPFPLYQDLTLDQLRDYLRWRTRFRRGKALPVDLSVLHLYGTELLCRAGTEDAFRDLCRLLKAYASGDRRAERFLTAWIRDDYLVRPPAEPFAELLRRYGAEAWFPAVFLGDSDLRDPLTLYNHLSQYKILASRFYRPDRHMLWNDCWRTVLAAVQGRCAAEGLDFLRFVRGAPAPDPDWLPFADAVGAPEAPPPPERTVRTLGPTERYEYAGGLWRCRLTAKTPSAAGALVGFLLKRMEARLRLLTRGKYRLTAEPAPLLRTLGRGKLYDLAASGALGIVVDEAADAWAAGQDLSLFAEAQRQKAPKPVAQPEPRPAPPPPVTIDFSQLDRIRGEAAETQRKLTVAAEEEIREAEAAPRQVSWEVPGSVAELFRSVRPSSADDPVAALCAALSPEQRRAVAEILAGTPAPPDELTMEAINELALDFLGDTLLDAAVFPPVMHEDYRAAWQAAAEKCST
ncbi:MAG: TerB N-terminal domain-containing protein [Oscillospiraceae bacterium]|nr:TerB N-terminal domain-containing protein [Oscillospiraceae bacterium]